jgi:hypothetical protein
LLLVVIAIDSFVTKLKVLDPTLDVNPVLAGITTDDTFVEGVIDTLTLA